MVDTLLLCSQGGGGPERLFVALGPVLISADRRTAQLVAYSKKGHMYGEARHVVLVKDDRGWYVKSRGLIFQG
jgi:hypothetical protein